MISTDWAKRAAACDGSDSEAFDLRADFCARPPGGCVGWLRPESIFFILTCFGQTDEDEYASLQQRRSKPVAPIFILDSLQCEFWEQSSPVFSA